MEESNNGILTMAIAVTVAMVVVCAVLVPIVDSVGNSDNENDGDSLVMVNKLSDYIKVRNNAEIPDDFKSYIYYDEWYLNKSGISVDMGKDTVLTLADFQEIVNMPITWGGKSGTIEAIHLNASSNGNKMLFNVKYHPAGPEIQIEYIEPASRWMEQVNLEDFSAFDLKINRTGGGNVKVVCDVTLERTGEVVHLDFDGEISEARVISKDANGWIIVGDREYTLNVTDGSALLSYMYATDGKVGGSGEGMVDQWLMLRASYDNPDWQFNDVSVTSDDWDEELPFHDYTVDFTLNFPHLDGGNVEITANRSPAGMFVEDFQVVSSSDDGYTLTAPEIYPIAISVCNSNPWDSETDDSSSSSEGVTATLLKVIPIFVVLGILVGVTQYFRAGRNGL